LIAVISIYSFLLRLNGFILLLYFTLSVICVADTSWLIVLLVEKLKLIKHKNIINYVKVQRLSWFSDVQRMPDTRTVKKIFNWKPQTKRSQERPKYRWEDNVKKDICQMKIENWTACFQDRGKWKGGR